MKKTILKIIVFSIVFVVSVVVISKIMNKDHDNLTMEMLGSRLPIVSMEKDGMVYNKLHGYVEPMDVAFMQDVVTVLGENRDTAFQVATYGRNVEKIQYEVRDLSGQRLVESTEIKNYEIDGGRIVAHIALKDLLEKNREYMLIIQLFLDNEEMANYYTRVLWSDSLHEMEKADFILDFHNRIFDKEAAKEIAKYMETSSRLEDNKSFHRVNIHSSFNQLTWGDLNVYQVGETEVAIKDIDNQTASFLLKYTVQSLQESSAIYYLVEEKYRVKYTSDRTYLLDYERNMTQIPDETKMFANNKILFGITQEDIPFFESADGNVVLYVIAGKLYSYNASSNKVSMIFGFYDGIHDDERCFYNQHDIKILDVDEGGNARFAVFGYMNRGRHEGEVGIQIYNFNSATNTIEEIVYIPYDKSYGVLKAQMDELLYANREEKLYLLLDGIIYGIDLVERTYNVIVDIQQDNSMQVSENHRILVWQEGDIYHCRKMSIRDLNTDRQSNILVPANEAVMPLGFMGEDVIYGVAREEDIREESSGRMFFPMYKVCICDSKGSILKNYEQAGLYVTDVAVEDNQITLNRVSRKENGGFVSSTSDHIMNNVKKEPGKNEIVTADIDVYERYVQLQVRNSIDTKTLQFLTPKEVVFEGGRNLTLELESENPYYYVYGAYGVEGIFAQPANAVKRAYDIAGYVTNNTGERIWTRANRMTKNQIMAIKEPEAVPASESLACCLDTILKYEGFVRNSAELLAKGDTVREILGQTMEDAEILDLMGCNLDSILFYVNQDIPVLAMLKNGEAVLLTGFNEFNVVIFEPSTGKLYKYGMNDTAQWMEENGNYFITYKRDK